MKTIGVGLLLLSCGLVGVVESFKKRNYEVAGGNADGQLVQSLQHLSLHHSQHRLKGKVRMSDGGVEKHNNPIDERFVAKKDKNKMSMYISGKDFLSQKSGPEEQAFKNENDGQFHARKENFKTYKETSVGKSDMKAVGKETHTKHRASVKALRDLQKKPPRYLDWCVGPSGPIGLQAGITHVFWIS